jgi:predicted transcriptional regulator
MKTATLPPIRVAPDLRLELEGVLEQGESLSQFVENAVRATVAKRKMQAEFVRRGMAAIEATKVSGDGIPADVVLAKLETKLVAAKQRKAQRAG